MVSDIQMRTLDDGHLSPLDFEAIQDNLRERLARLDSDVIDALRAMDSTLGEGTVTFPMLWGSERYTPDRSVFSQMPGFDGLHLVSAHETTVIAGWSCIECQEPTNLYFSVSADDDNQTLFPGYAYGFRAGIGMNLNLSIRFLTRSAGTISVTYLSGSTFVPLARSGGNSWDVFTYDFSTYRDNQQTFTAVESGTLHLIEIFAKRDSGLTSGTATMRVFACDANGAPTATLLGESAPIDLTTLSTTGGWAIFEFPTAVALTKNQRYAISPRGPSATGGNAYWQYASSGNPYPEGARWVGTLEGWQQDANADYIGSYNYSGEFTKNIVTTAGFRMWSVETVNLPNIFLNHQYYAGENLADFYITLPAGAAINSVALYSRYSGAEAHWRCGHVRSRHIPIWHGGATGHVWTQQASGVPDWAALPPRLAASATAAATDTVTTTSTTFVDLPNMSVTVDVPSSGTVLLLATVLMRNNTSGKTIYVNFSLGSTQLEGYHNTFPAANHITIVTFHMLLTNVSAGSKNYKIRWCTDSGTTATALTRRLTALVW